MYYLIFKDKKDALAVNTKHSYHKINDNDTNINNNSSLFYFYKLSNDQNCFLNTGLNSYMANLQQAYNQGHSLVNFKYASKINQSDARDLDWYN
jgi:hypothetical protein